MQTKILILEDDRRILEILAFAVGREGYQIIKASNGPAGIQTAKERLPDLIILDSSSNDGSAMDIVEVCTCLRKECVTAPILALIKAEEEKQGLLSAGAEDFIIKPFAMRELLTRVRANTWHITEEPVNNTEAKECLVFGRIVIDLNQIVALKDDVPLDLTQLEFDLLVFLAKEPGKVFKRKDLLYHVWGYTGFTGDVRAVDVSIRRLGKKSKMTQQIRQLSLRGADRVTYSLCKPLNSMFFKKGQDAPFFVVLQQGTTRFDKKCKCDLV